MIGAKKRMEKAKHSKVPLIIDTVTGAHSELRRKGFPDQSSNNTNGS